MAAERHTGKQTMELQGGDGMIVLVPLEGAASAEIDRNSREVQEQAGPGLAVLVGRCWLKA
jgi:hypothetical protein